MSSAAAESSKVVNDDFRKKWPELARTPRKFRAVPGENPVVLGRRFCSACGRWRLLLDFGVGRYMPGTDTPAYFQAHCRTCQRVRNRIVNGYKPQPVRTRLSGAALSARQRENYRRRREDPEWLAGRREYERIYTQAKRRDQGVAERNWRRGGERDKGKGSYADAVDAGPFIEWLDRWIARQDRMRTSTVDSFDRRIAGLDELAELAGTHPRSLYRARETGRISITLVDRVLVAAGADVMLIHLYPELYPDVVPV
jgi:hypothetical protein